MPLDTDILHVVSPAMSWQTATAQFSGMIQIFIALRTTIFTRHCMARLHGLRGRSLEACLLKTTSSLTENHYDKINISYGD